MSIYTTVTVMSVLHNQHSNAQLSDHYWHRVAIKLHIMGDDEVGIVKWPPLDGRMMLH